MFVQGSHAFAMFLTHALRECALFRSIVVLVQVARYLLAEYDPGYSVWFLATKEAGYGAIEGRTFFYHSR